VNFPANLLAGYPPGTLNAHVHLRGECGPSPAVEYVTGQLFGCRVQVRPDCHIGRFSPLASLAWRAIPKSRQATAEIGKPGLVKMISVDSAMR